jgi:hypothetical protein
LFYRGWSDRKKTGLISKDIFELTSPA